MSVMNHAWSAIKNHEVTSGMRKLLFLIIMLLASGMRNDAAMGDGRADKIMNDDSSVEGSNAHLTPADTVQQMVDHPAFRGFGQYLLPSDNRTDHLNTPLSNVGSLLPYHNHVAPNIGVCAINHINDQVNDGKIIFYDFYTEQQKQKDPIKASTGLFFSGENRELHLLWFVLEEVLPMSVPSTKVFLTQ